LSHAPCGSAEFDFCISLDPDSGRVCRPNPIIDPEGTCSVSTDARIELVSGETQPVTISVANEEIPSGVYVSFPGGNSCSPDPDHGCSITITFNVDDSAGLSVFYITVTATGGGKTRSETFSLEIIAGPDL